MTPEAISLIAKLRSEFYSLFAAAMSVPVKITAHSYSRNFPIACWVNSQEQLNYLSLYAHSAPDELFPLRPLLLRVAVNRGAGSVMLIKPGIRFRDMNQEWHFELTATPEEITDFVPWLVSLIETQEQVASAEVKPPPHPLEFVSPVTCSFKDTCNHAWTEKAWDQTDEIMAQLIDLRTNPSTLHRSNEASIVFSL
ncbi:MAG: hypothetical protein JOZ78_03130 [Chroococcidiopsidaceae cyanobacterium CP_BM_ER_R8_30]|nr:hypothetical protein [Chroococcidiopsidaceae cyanobacterium CP_BM_ER_R8_30]